MFNRTKNATTSRLSQLLLCVTLASSLIAAGCGNDLNEDKNDNNPTHASNNKNNDPDDDDKTYPNLSHIKSSEGYTTTTVNTTSADKWIYLQLSTGEEKTLNDPATSMDWDLSFQRFSILVNGGVSGPSDVKITHLNGVKFEDVTRAPDAEYRTDIEGVPDERGQNPGLAFLAEDTWYDYNGTTHQLSVRDRVYVIHASTGEYYKVQFLDYYDQAGTSGFLKFNWQEIDAPQSNEQPEEPDFPLITNTIDATSEDEFVYLDVATNAQVIVADPETSDGWDLAFQKTTILVNGGVSGAGNVAIAHVDDVSFDDVTEESALEFRTDQETAGEAFKADSNWYAYDMSTHTLSARNRVYLIQNTGGDLFKVQFVSYYDENSTPGHITLRSQQLK